MFAFLRKYQRYFFLVISVVIIISFSFFGTYNALPSEETRTQTAFYAADGTAISRSELDQMVLFLSTDIEDKVLFGGYWGPNFLNNGVIKIDFLQNGLADILAKEFPADIESDLKQRLQNERRYELYSHPDSSAVSTESVWAYAAPGMKSSFDLLHHSQDPVTPAAFNARVKLYLGEKRIPSSYLRQYLMYQQQQLSWLTPDPNLERIDLSLFGYHTLEDWFGPNFIRIAAEFVINSAKAAEKQGYSVPMDEAIADLNRNAIISFQQNLKSPNLGVANSQEYLNEQLRIMGMDQRMAAKIWQNVLLFRRLFQDAGNSIFIEPTAFAAFTHYAKQSVSGELFQLPKELRLADYRSMQKFEIYNAAVAQIDPKSPLNLPANFLSVNEVKKNYPELIQKRYLLQVSNLDKNSLLSKVSLKETWNWEVQDANWAVLKKQFPNLASQGGETREERFKALDRLNPKVRASVDAVAQSAIVNKHPEWIINALQTAPSKTIEISLSPKRASDHFSGLENAAGLIALLDQVDLSTQDETAQENKSNQLNAFTADQRHYYKIKVLERQPNEEILTFAEANKSGILDALLDRKLKEHYEKIKTAQAAQFQNSDKSWKSYDEVKDIVADHYFAKVLNALKSDRKNQSLTGNQAASMRLSSYVQGLKEKMQRDPTKIPELINVSHGKTSNALHPSNALADQWKIEKQSFEINRSSEDERLNLTEITSMGEWSDLKTTANGGLYFIRKFDLNAADHSFSLEKNNFARLQLSNEIQKVLGNRFAEKWKAQKAISLEYLQINAPEAI